MLGMVISCIGLTLDILGALALWKYGLPQILDRKGAQYLTTGIINEADATKAAKYDSYSKIGLAMLVLGFVGQLIGTILSSYHSR
jgi:hypothetical protein